MPALLLLTTLFLQAAGADPFSAATAAQLKSYRAVVETTKGSFTLEFLPEKAPETVRQFLRLAAAEVYDNTLVHRVLPGTLIQTGAPFFRSLPLTGRQQRLIHDLKPEFNDTKAGPGVVFMARGDEANSAQTSFFICVGPCKEYERQYTAFARVASGMPVVRAISAVPLNGTRPKEKIVVIRVMVSRRG